MKGAWTVSGQISWHAVGVTALDRFVPGSTCAVRAGLPVPVTGRRVLPRMGQAVLRRKIEGAAWNGVDGRAKTWRRVVVAKIVSAKPGYEACDRAGTGPLWLARRTLCSLCRSAWISPLISRRRCHNPRLRPRGIAQLVEHRSPKPRVVGSSPPAPARLGSLCDPDFPAILVFSAIVLHKRQYWQDRACSLGAGLNSCCAARI